MKTIFSSGAAVLLLFAAAHDSSATQDLPSGQNPVVQAKSAAQKARAPGTAAASKASKEATGAQNRSATSAAVAPKEEFSPMFQVSPDPRDKVQISVRNGIVTVRGSVGTRDLAQQLINKYRRTPRVREVRNRLTVRTNPDVEIAARVRESLARDADLHEGGIAVAVCEGVVFLSGSVSSEQESNRAEVLAQGLPGVKRVSNGLRFSTAKRSPVRLISRSRTYSRR